MTSLAFVFGVAPLVVATGAGSEMRQSLGTTGAPILSLHWREQAAAARSWRRRFSDQTRALASERNHFPRIHDIQRIDGSL
jgi:AcrB/AcrD/AcrF family